MFLLVNYSSRNFSRSFFMFRAHGSLTSIEGLRITLKGFDLFYGKEVRVDNCALSRSFSFDLQIQCLR